MQRALLASLALALSTAIATPAAAQLPEDLRYDYAATMFNASSHMETRDRARVDVGWSLRLESLRIDRLSDRTISRDSVIKLVIKKGSRVVGQNVCRVSLPNHAIFARNCEQRDQRIQEHGALTVEVIFVDGSDDREYPVATHTIQVVQYGTARGNGDPGENQYYISASANLPVGVIVQSEGGISYMGRSSYNLVELLLWTAHPNQNMNREGPSTRPFSSSQNRLVCTVNGERVPIEDSQVTSDEHGFVASTRSWGQARRDEQEEYNVRRFTLNLPLTWGERLLPRRLNMDEHPGRYECEIQNRDREVLRTISFTYENGEIQPHPEQAAGLSLAHRAHLVEMRFPENVQYETRLSRETVGGGAFYGRPWQSEEARTMFRSVPNVGRPEMEAPSRRGGGRGASSMRSSSSMRRRR